MTHRIHARTACRAAVALCLAPLAFPAPQGPFELVESRNGFDQLLPHRIDELDANGNPTGVIIDIRDFADLADNTTSTNGVLPSLPWPGSAQLPNGLPGNQFLLARFSAPIDVDTVLDSSVSGQANSGLIGTIVVVAVDPITGQSTPVQGRAFVGGKTYAGTPTGNQLPLQSWVVISGNQLAPTAIDNDNDLIPDGLGFPGTETGTSFAGDLALVARESFVFVPDVDGRLDTHETFPAGVIQLRISGEVASVTGDALGHGALATSTVGADLLAVEIAVGPGGPVVDPPNGSLDVDPRTEVRMQFTEAVQPLDLGPLDGAPPGLSAAVQLEYGAAVFQQTMPFTVRPAHVFDLARWILTPAIAFPGTGTSFPNCGALGVVDVTLQPGELDDLSGNTNLLGAATFFETGDGPGLVNAPVTPDALYVGGRFPNAGISVIDLNGFGASTGSPRHDFTGQTVHEGDSNYPNNPNVKFQGTFLRPPLGPGSCTVDGGSAGVFTLTKDSNLDAVLVRAPIVTGVADMALGHSLDTTFNNAQFPFGCQAGGGEICTLDGLKIIDFSTGGPNTIAPEPPGGFGVGAGIENVVSWGPTPNPPPLVFPPLCAVPNLGGLEPTSVDVTVGATPLANLLVPGDAFGNPLNNPPIPPSGLISPEQNGFFTGPSHGQVNLSSCVQYQTRQQVGQFLYVVDRDRSEVVVLNSNRMTVVDRLAIESPTELALGTDLDLLAVTQREHDTVSFVDVDPSSSTFHEVVQVTAVGDRPVGVAWEPGNEDIFVCNTGDDSVSILSAFSLQVRKTLTANIVAPVDVAITDRQAGHGYLRNVYFAYILNRDGTVAIFESGPGGVNGWGYDEVIGIAPYTFQRPKAIQPDPLDVSSAVWIAHEGPIDLSTGQSGPVGVGAISRLHVDSSVTGMQILTAANASTPQFRNMTMVVDESVGEGPLTGIPVDIAFDDLRNFGGIANLHTPFGAGAPVVVNGKSLVRRTSTGSFVNTNEPLFLFAAVPAPTASGPSQVDVLTLGQAGLPRQDTNAFRPGVQSVPSPGASVLADYFRQ